MPRDPLAWLPLLRHWTHCLGEGPDAIPRMGDLNVLPQLDLAALLPGGPGWTDVQRSLRHDPEGAFRLLYYGLALRGLESLPAPERVVLANSIDPPVISVLIPVFQAGTGKIFGFWPAPAGFTVMAGWRHRVAL